MASKISSWFARLGSGLSFRTVPSEHSGFWVLLHTRDSALIPGFSWKDRDRNHIIKKDYWNPSKSHSGVVLWEKQDLRKVTCLSRVVILFCFWFHICRWLDFSSWGRTVEQACNFQPLFTCAPARCKMKKVNTKRSDTFLFSFFFVFSPKYAQGDNQMFVFLSEHKFGYIYVTRGSWTRILFHNRGLPGMI